MVRAMSEKASPAPALKPGDHLFLVDGSNFIFRAYFPVSYTHLTLPTICSV